MLHQAGKYPTPQRTVLLYSGGMDSEIVRVLYKPEVCLFIDNGSRYSALEFESIRRRFGTNPQNLPGFQHIDLRSLRWMEDPDTSIVPTRNALFVTLASLFGNRIWLAATVGDRIKDKDETFADLSSALLSHIWQPMWWTEGYPRVKVELPVKHLSKGQLLAQYIAQGGDGQELWEASFTCYRPTMSEAPCGVCKACWRKWVTFRVNGFDLRPKKAAVDYLLAEVVPKILAGTNGRGAEDDETLEALRLEGIL